MRWTGSNLSRIVVPESFSDFIDLVIPELQDRGLYKTAYAPGSLRGKLFGEGIAFPPAMPPTHSGMERSHFGVMDEKNSLGSPDRENTRVIISYKQ